MSECLLNKTNMFPVSVSNGGTGVSTLTSGNILLGNGTSAITSLATLTVAKGGTGSTTASGVRTNLGLVTEFGSWTPSIKTNGSTQPTVTYSFRYGYYYRISNMVYVSCRLKFQCTNIGTSNACIGTLPFVSSESMFSPQALAKVEEYYASTDSNPTGYILGSNSMIFLSDSNGNNNTTWKVYASTDQYVGFSGCYLI